MTGETPAARPPILEVHTAHELRRWYWLRTELVDLARHLDVPSGGGKLELTARLAAALEGAPLPPAARRRSASTSQLTGPLTRDTIIPEGQRSSQVLRDFFRAEIGASFRFDGPMREFVEHGAGRTLGEAVEQWHATRDRPRGEIAPQFELNRFVRAWHEQHPDGARADALEAWRRFRSLPVDERA